MSNMPGLKIRVTVEKSGPGLRGCPGFKQRHEVAVSRRRKPE
jgi:hypothetical protein